MRMEQQKEDKIQEEMYQLKLRREKTAIREEAETRVYARIKTKRKNLDNN